jgi:membrane protein DedA with SNARE-associated domain
VLRLPLRVWLPLDYLGAVVSNTVWVGAGAILGTALLTEDGTLEEHPAIRIGLIALGVTWFVVLRQVVSRRLAELRRGRVEASDRVPDEIVAD